MLLTREIWHTTDAITDNLNVNPEMGLTHAEVEKRLAEFGPNELTERPLKSPWVILWEQLVQPLVLLLIFAAVVSALLGKVDNVIAIIAIVILNAILGLVQEYRSERAMAALKQMAASMVRVRRDGNIQEVASNQLVPGDVLLLETGNVVPADARLIEAANLRVQEAAITGESYPVDKAAGVLHDPQAPLADRVNMVYMGTAVTYGRGTAIVTDTGMRTELGKIAELIQGISGDKTPLQRRMGELGKIMIGAAVVIMALSFVIGLLRGDPMEEILITSVAIAVAVVPEGLPAVVTISLALGAQRMLGRNALIRQLPAVETLGSVTVICSDKTGTLTQNLMTVQVLDVAGHTVELDLTHALYDVHESTSRALLLTASALCNDAELQWSTTDEFRAVGDPTEGAMVIAAARHGLLQPELKKMLPRVGEVPFASERKRMTTIHGLKDDYPSEDSYHYIRHLFENSKYVAFTKGAVDRLLEISDYVWVNDRSEPITDKWRQRIEANNNQLAKEGLRVLGVAIRLFDNLESDWEAAEAHVIFVGMIGMIDPPRLEVKEAVGKCKTAGIRPVMITGDHPLTAQAIAHDLGILSEGGQVVTGHELEALSPADLEGIVETVCVYARVSPEHKLKIIQALQHKGHIVAMTGDGVNDAPALKQADIGVAMGITGTDVTKEAADMVIVDDNFATIVNAVEEGRTIYDNVRRFVKYLLASNTGELFVLLSSQLIAGMMLPLTTLQILWMNLITDGIPALALGIEKTERDTMKRPPYAPNESVLGRGLGRHILIVGTLLGGTGLGLGYWAWSTGIEAANGAPAWNTMVFMLLTLAQMGHALGVRSHRDSLFMMRLLDNKLLIAAVILTVTLQLIAIYTPFFNDLFNTNPLTLGQLVLCFGLGTIVFWGVELEKLLIRRGVLD